ncbi:MAG: chemotaxis protein CheA [Gammaproteobacteria bacterium]|nr:chemotaxis protein CheA [Gammaproteobacteria bacterium]MBI5617431.1 chemotaxis protein CheA [Gammaproteobacteria bacterium]
MSVDISQFHQVFFEESFEGLEIMETGLLDLEDGADLEAINTIFRAAHSIKGGSGTFGFSAIANFTHGMETLLDEMRSGRRKVARAEVDVLLSGVDCLRGMLAATRDNAPLDLDAVAATQRRLEALLQGASPQAGAAAPGPLAGNTGFRVRFAPEPHLFKTGNDPVRLLRELCALAPCAITVDVSKLPATAELDPETCYLSWDCVVEGEVSEPQIREIFEWVEADAEIVITPLAAPEAGAPAALTLAPPAVERRADDDRRQNEDRRQGDRRATAPANAPASSIRVDIEKVDALINMVGELVITQSMLSQFSQDEEITNLEKLREGLLQLERNTRELQERVMSIRMLPISFAFNRFPRLVRDLSAKLGKEVNLELNGETTELDKTVMEKIGDPLVHLVRNSLDHGVEMPEVRLAAGKPAAGTLTLDAYHEGGAIVIEITDDGAGLDTGRIQQKARERGLIGETETLTEEQACEMIFHAGFSTAEVVSDVSGRGVGMDVVRRNIKDLGGVVEVTTKQGEGSTFRIRLPLTLAILDGQLIRVGDQVYIVPLVSIIESLQVRPESVSSIGGARELYRLRDDYLPVVRLYEQFGIDSAAKDLEDGLLVVVEGDGRRIGLFVDELLGQQQVVIKSLQTNFRRVRGISGATILGDGRVAMILDIAGLITLCHGGASTGSARQVAIKVA